MVPIPSLENLDMSLALEFLANPGILALLAGCIVAGLLAGKRESDAAKTGNPEYRGMENLTLYDWLEDAGYGLLGGMLGLATIQLMPAFPLLSLPAFGYAGRKILINYGRKAEGSIESPPPQ